MKIHIVETYYDAFLKDYADSERAAGAYKAHALEYSIQFQTLMQKRFGIGDACAAALRKLGHNVTHAIVNCEALQKQWAREHHIRETRSLLGRIPRVRALFPEHAWLLNIAQAQINDADPDVLYLHNIKIFPPALLMRLKRNRVLIGQVASELPNDATLRVFDLLITSLPNFAAHFESLGIRTLLLPLAFDARITEELSNEKKQYDLTFIGSMSRRHTARAALLEEVAQSLPVHFWGAGIEHLGRDARLRENYHGAAWGRNMYRILACSKIVINTHIDLADRYANNMRLFETTGVGSFLLTDAKPNLGTLFRVGEEIETYATAAELIDKARNYLTQEDEREKIARAGCARTRAEHTYDKRMETLVSHLKSLFPALP